MATTASQSLNTVYDFDGSSTYVDYTKEARTRAGTSFTVFSATSKYLYLGNDEKFDMAFFDILNLPQIRSFPPANTPVPRACYGRSC